MRGRGRALRLLVVLVAALGAASLARGSEAAGPSRLRTQVGSSVAGRPIVARLVAPAQAWCTMLVVGSIAGDEPGGIAVAKLLASGPPIRGVDLWVIPDLNPDGAARGTRQNARGVDLNRNFPFRWRRLGSRGSRYWSGPTAGSEPETQAFEGFLEWERPGLTVWVHQPYGLVDDSQGPLWAERSLGRSLRLPLGRLPDYPGSAIGWTDHLVRASAFDVELPWAGRLTLSQARLVAGGIRLLARQFAARS